MYESSTSNVRAVIPKIRSSQSRLRHLGPRRDLAAGPGSGSWFSLRSVAGGASPRSPEPVSTKGIPPSSVIETECGSATKTKCPRYQARASSIFLRNRAQPSFSSGSIMRNSVLRAALRDQLVRSGIARNQHVFGRSFNLNFGVRGRLIASAVSGSSPPSLRLYDKHHFGDLPNYLLRSQRPSCSPELWQNLRA